MHELEQRVLDPARASSEQQPAPSSSSSSSSSSVSASHAAHTYTSISTSTDTRLSSHELTAHEVVLEPLLAVKAEPKTEPAMETKRAERSTEPDESDDADADALGLGDWRSKHI